jgi:antirestriction protein ArdC
MSTSSAVVQARQDLEAAVLALRDSATWRRNLAIMARFHHYSINNQLLIAYQRPTATFVRGFKSWLACGRAVRKGERGIAIFAPRPWSRTETNDAGDDETESGISFRVVYVFDVAQTDPVPGHPHPWQPPDVLPAAGDAAQAAALWDALADHAAALGLTVSTSETDAPRSAHVYGYYQHSTQLVWVRPAAAADMAATLAHEIAHAVTHEPAAGMARDVHELIAESVAYVVCSQFGLDLSLRSTDYVAGWIDDPAAFRAGMAVIHHAAASLIDAVTSALVASAPLTLAA